MTQFTYEAKAFQLMQTAESLGVAHRFTKGGVEFSYNGDRELFSKDGAPSWHLDESYEPWFFGIARDDLEEARLLADELAQLRTTFSRQALARMMKFVRAGGTL